VREIDSEVESPILVTGVAGRVGAVGRTIVELLRQRGRQVHAMVWRDDERAAALRAAGAEVVVGDLTNGSDVARALGGCRWMYFGMSVSAGYLEATVIAAAAARERGDLEVLVNISQMTVSQMTLTEMTESPQHRQHFLAELVLNWSGVPVVHVRPTVFLENPLSMNLAARSIAKDDTIRLPFGTGRTSPIAAEDVAEVIATILADPLPHIGRIYELTGPKSQNMVSVAEESSAALDCEITYVDVPLEQWPESDLRGLGLPSHVFEHILTMGCLHAANRYDRITHDVEAITGRPATSIHDFVSRHASLFSAATRPERR
jgi:NAD(P)H dehydrogenase (quinone)